MNTMVREESSAGWVLRHSLNVRICHWINAVAFFGLLITGFAIFLTYPELYWGHVGYRGHAPALRLADIGLDTPLAWTEETRRWGRNYHFTFSWLFAINGLIYLIWNALRKHFRRRLLPARHELSPSHLKADIRDHLRLRVPTAVAATGYNTLQKLTYLFVVFGVCPLIVITGLGQSPAITAAFPELLTIFGGRQSIRSLHMICTLLLVLFLLVHVFQVFVAGFANEMRSMITGRYAIPKEERR
jgi:thiosulfate reductase cytochrome b subunit